MSVGTSFDGRDVSNLFISSHPFSLRVVQNNDIFARGDCMKEHIEIPTLISNRLILRPFALSDSKQVQRQAGNPSVAATTATIPHPYPDGAAEEWISLHAEWFQKGINVNWAIVLKEKNELIGCMSLGINKAHCRAEIAYWIGEEFWNNGYCSEAARESIRYAFESLNLNKITSRHMSKNQSSGKVMINAGMEKEGYLKQDFCKNGNFVDMVIYGLLREKVLFQ